MKATAKTVAAVIRKYADFVEKEPVGFRREHARDVNTLLDRIAYEDGFGTEGQLDPRGDRRNET